MKTKFSLFLILFFLLMFNLRAQESFNPFKSIDKEATVLTLSEGKYEEFFDTDTIAIVGSAVLNIKTMKVIGFIVTDTAYSEATLEPEIVSRWLSIDPLARKYPSESPYIFTGDNPIYFIDVEGKYKYPADKAASYKNDYSVITKYLASYVYNDVMNSSILKTALEQHSGGNLTEAEIAKAVTWDSGPNIEFRDNPGGAKGAFGHYNSKTKTIEINSGFAKMLQDASPEDQQAALLALFGTLLHETVHYGEHLEYKDRPPGDHGSALVQDVFTNQTNSNGIVDYGDANIGVSDLKGGIDVKSSIDHSKTIIDRKSKSEDTKSVLPTVPE